VNGAGFSCLYSPLFAKGRFFVCLIIVKSARASIAKRKQQQKPHEDGISMSNFSIK
jgi:hypothetical protein